jgi:hypothetical protein
MNRIPRTLAIVGVLLTAALLGGCQLGQAIIAMSMPNEKVAAKCKFPPHQKLLIFPDDKETPLSYPPVKRELAQQIAALLIANKVAVQVVPYDELDKLRDSDPDFNTLAIAAVARKLEADLVLYIDITQFSLKESDAAALWRGNLEARVKVIDAKATDPAKARLWPDEAGGYTVKVSEPTRENVNQNYGAELSKLMAAELAGKIDALFHDHEINRAQAEVERERDKSIE